MAGKEDTIGQLTSSFDPFCSCVVALLLPLIADKHPTFPFSDTLKFSPPAQPAGASLLGICHLRTSVDPILLTTSQKGTYMKIHMKISAREDTMTNSHPLPTSVNDGHRFPTSPTGPSLSNHRLNQSSTKRGSPFSHWVSESFLSFQCIIIGSPQEREPHSGTPSPAPSPVLTSGKLSEEWVRLKLSGEIFSGEGGGGVGAPGCAREAKRGSPFSHGLPNPFFFPVHYHPSSSRAWA